MWVGGFARVAKSAGKPSDYDITALPTDDTELAITISNAIGYARSVRRQEEVKWALTRLWLRGVREFSAIDYASGTVLGHYGGDDLRMVVDTALSSCQQEIGRLSKLSLSPVVLPLPLDLEGVRKSAMGHTFLTYHSPRMGYDMAVREHNELLVHYGTVRVSLQELPTVSGREEEWRPRYRVTPPWQLLSIPGAVLTNGDLRAVVHQRYVPYAWLEVAAKQSKASPGIQPQIKLPDDRNKMNPKAIPLGALLTESNLGTEQFGAGIVGNFNSDQRPGQKSGDLCTEDHILLSEVHFSHDNLHLDQVVILGGDYLIGQRNYWKEGIEVWNTGGISRYAETGSFWGRSYAESKITMNRVVEELLAAQVRVARDYEAFGILMVPSNSGIKRSELLRRRDGGPRMATFRLDPLSGDASQPFNIKPDTAGDVPTKVMGVVQSVDNQIFPQRSIFSPDAPQRADSPNSLAQISAAAAEDRAPTTDHMIEAFNAVHRAVLDAGRRRFLGKSGVLPLVQMDLSMVGITYDPQLGQIKLDANAMPMPDEVKVTVESRSPKDKNVVAQHLWTCLQSGVMTPRQFRIEWRKENIGPPVSNNAEWLSYQRAIFNLIRAFGDGKTPGAVNEPPTGVADVHTSTYAEFMADIRFALASKEVRAQIQNLYLAYSQSRGLPNGMQNPEDYAAQQQGQEPQGGGMPGSDNQLMQLLAQQSHG